MNKYGFLRVASAIPGVKVADCISNVNEITRICDDAFSRGTEIIVFPELSITGYTCADLFCQQLLLDKSDEALCLLCKESSRWTGMTVVVGAPVRVGAKLYNCAVVMNSGNIHGIAVKSFLPNYNEFYEKRWFSESTNTLEYTDLCDIKGIPVSSSIIFTHGKAEIFIELCEDVWTPIPPSSNAAMAGANVILNLSASDEVAGKHNFLISLLKQHSAQTISAYIYSSAGYGESSTDVVFAGNALIFENGEKLSVSRRFSTEPQLIIADIDIDLINHFRLQKKTFTCGLAKDKSYIRIPLAERTKGIGKELLRKIEPMPFVPHNSDILDDRCEEIVNIQVAGLMQRLDFTRCKSLVIGVSGGLDSTLALLIAAKAFDRLGIDRKGIYGITMPGFGTSGRTYNNALDMLGQLGVTTIEIPIADAVMQHFKDIGHNPENRDITYENSQARERTQILMDYANKVGGMVLGTGDLSELALGWATYNGDQMSMYGVNASVPKTLVKHLVRHIAEKDCSGALRNTLIDVYNTPISPELLPSDSEGNIAQKTEDLVGPYELHDFFIFNTLHNGFAPDKVFYLACKAFENEYDAQTVRHWLSTFYRRFFNQQFKRSCMPDGPKTGVISLSPRGDWKMPSDASSAMWLNSEFNKC